MITLTVKRETVASQNFPIARSEGERERRKKGREVSVREGGDFSFSEMDYLLDGIRSRCAMTTGKAMAEAAT